MIAQRFLASRDSAPSTFYNLERVSPGVSGDVRIPDIAGSGNGGGTLVDVLLANLIRDERNQRLVAGD